MMKNSTLIYPRSRNERGFTLIELMIGLVVGMFVIGVIITVFVQSKRNYNQDEQVAYMQENGRYALQLLSREIAHAGFLGGMSAIDSVSPDGTISFTNDCADWFNPVSAPLEIYPAADAAGKDCFSGETVKPLTQVLVVKRTAGKESNTLAANKLYFTTPGQGGSIFKSTGSAVPAAYASQQQWEYYVEIFYIKNEDSDGDGVLVPGLFRKRLNVQAGNITVTDDGLLVPGIRQFGVLYGLDTLGEDGIADKYLEATDYDDPATDDFTKIVSARISVLAMSTDDDPNTDNTKQYSLYPSVLPADDVAGLTDSHYYGRVFTTSTQVRNNVYRIQIYSLTK
jgi:type IV pilus assembly protein PilW